MAMMAAVPTVGGTAGTTGQMKGELAAMKA